VELINADFNVILADDFSNSREDTPARIGRITGTVPPLYAADVADRAALSHIFEERRIDAVIHFAGFKAVGESVAQPVRYYRNNLGTALTLLKSCGSMAPKHSCSAPPPRCTATRTRCPSGNTAPAGRCSNPYGRTKYFIEQILTDAAAADPALSVVLLRYFKPIGAHESGLIASCRTGSPTT
jgi:UDP-glucose 4-epimerase